MEKLKDFSTNQSNRFTRKRPLSTWKKFLLFGGAFLFTSSLAYAVTVTYSHRIAYFTVFSAGSSSQDGTYNNGGNTNEIGQYAQGSGGQTVAWRTLRTADGTGGSARELQHGDEFTISVFGDAPFGVLGVSLNDGASTGSWANRHSNSRLYVQTGTNDGANAYANWFVHNNGSQHDSGANLGDETDEIEIEVTSHNTFNARVDGGSWRYNLTMTNSPGVTDKIDGYAVYYNDDWDGGGRQDAFWKPTTSVENLGNIHFGGANNLTPGYIDDGLAADSTSTVSTNRVIKFGTHTLTLARTNNYSGGIQIEAGTVIAGQDTAFGRVPASVRTNAVTLWGAGTLRITNTMTLTANRGITLDNSGNGSITVDATKTFTVAGVIASDANSEGMVKKGAGILALSGQSTFGGDLFMDDGTVELSNTGDPLDAPFVRLGIGSGSSGVTTLRLAQATGDITVDNGVVIRSTGGAKTIHSANTSGTNEFTGSEIALDGNVTLTVDSGGTVEYSPTAFNMKNQTITIDGAGTTVFTTVMTNSTGNGKLVKTGTGTAKMNSHSYFSGATTVSNGTYEVNGTNTASAITVGGDGTLGGVGSAGDTTLFGTLNPGLSPGEIEVNALTLQTNATLTIEITNVLGTAGVNWDLTTVSNGSGVVTLNATSTDPVVVDVDSLGADPANWDNSTFYSWLIIDAGSISGGFASNKFTISTNNFTADLGGETFKVREDSGDIFLEFGTFVTDDDEDYPFIEGMFYPDATNDQANGKTALQPGDVAIIGFHSDDPEDMIVWINLVDLAPNVVINFTDMGVEEDQTFGTNHSGSAFTGDGILSWTNANELLPAGTMVTLTNVAEGTISASTGGVSRSFSDFDLRHDGDQVMMFQGSTNNPIWLHGVQFRAGSDSWDGDASDDERSALPLGLKDGDTAISLTHQDSYSYGMSVTTGTASEIFAAINDPESNWTGNNSANNITLPPVGAFSVTNGATAQVMTDGQMRNGGWGITGMVFDTTSGINSNGTPGTTFPFPPNMDVFNPSGTEVITNHQFDIVPTDGGATTAEDLALNSAPAMTAANVALGVYTSILVVADNDDDIAADELRATIYSSFEVIDDDTNGPVFSAFSAGDGPQQSYVEPGDIALVGYNSEGSEQISFISMVSITSSVDIVIDDDGSVGSGFVTYTTPSTGLLAGTVVVIDDPGGSPSVVRGGGTVVEDGAFNLVNSSEGLLVTFATTNIYYLRRDGATTYTGLSTGANTINDVDNDDNGAYTNSVRVGAKADLLAAIAVSTDWEYGDGSGDQSITLTASPYSDDFTIAGIGDGELTDGELFDGGWSLSGLVQDTGSGVNSNSVASGDDFGVNFDLLNPSGTAAINDSLFDIAPADGSAQSSPGLLSDSVAAVSAANNALGVWTGRVSATDNDEDRSAVNDRTATIDSEEFTFTVIDDDTNFPAASSFVISGASGVSTVTVTELSSGTGWSITGLVMDADSGLNVNGTQTAIPTNSPFFQLLDPAGTVKLTEAFGTLTFADGGATTNAPASDTSPGTVGGGISTGTWTARVVLTDNDFDRGDADALTFTNEFTFTVIEIVDDPTGTSATADGEQAIDLAWTLNGSGHDVVIVRYDGASPTETEPSGTLNVGDSVGAGTVVYKGGDTSFKDVELTENSTYTYYFYSVNGTSYSPGVSQTETTANTFKADEIYDSFSYGALTDDLDGEDGGTGFTNAWSESTAGSFTNVTDSFPAFTSFPEAHGHRMVVNPPAAASRNAVRGFAGVDCGELFVAFKINYDFGEAGGGGDGKFVGVSFMDGTTEEIFFGEVGNLDAALGIGVSGDGSDANNGASSMSPDVDYVLIGKYDFRSKVVSLISYTSAVNIPTNEPGSYTVTTTMSTGPSNIDGISLAAGAGTGTPGATFFDEVRVAKSWGDLLTYGPPRITESTVDTDNEITDAQMNAGNFEVVVEIQTPGSTLDTDGTPFEPNFDIMAPTEGEILTDEDFATFNGSDTVTNISDSAYSIAYGDIELGIHTIRVSAISTDGSSTIDNPYQQDTCETNTFSVVDDDSDTPVVENFGTGINTKYGSGSSGKALVVATNSVLVDDRSGSGTNTIYTLTDGVLATLSVATNLEFAIAANDPTSEISQGLSGTTNTVMSFSVGTALSGTDVIPAFNATASGGLPGAGNETTNVWAFSNATIFTSTVISNLLDGQTNYVYATIPDNDNDRTNDASVLYHHQVGAIYVVDDDDDCPVASSFFISGASGISTVTVSELAGGTGWSITGLVSDALSGINVDGSNTVQPTNSPYFQLVDTNGTVRLTEVFGTIGFTDGGATSDESIGDTSPASIGGLIGTGVWTARVVLADNDADYGLNDVRVCTNEFTFTVVSSTDDPVGTSATADGEQAIDLAWTPNGSGDDVLIVRYVGASPTETEPSGTVNVGDSVGAGTAIFNGSGTSFKDVELTENTTYTYYFYSVDGTTYSDGVDETETTANTFKADEIYDSFSYGALDETLDGEDGGTGFTNAWSESNAGSFTNVTDSFPAFTSYPEAHGHRVVVNPPNAVNRTAVRGFAGVDCGELFVAFKINYDFGEAGGGGDGKFVGVSFMDGTTEEIFFGEVGGLDAALGIGVVGDGSDANNGASSMSPDVDYVLIGKYDFRSKVVSLISYTSAVNIPTNEPGSYTVTTTMSTGPSNIDGIRLAAGAGTGTPGATFFDEVRVAKSWGDLLTYGPPRITESTVDTDNEITDAQMNAGNFEVVVEIQTPGSTLDTDGTPFEPNFDIMAPTEGEILTDEDFATFNGSDTVTNISDSAYSIAYGDIELGIHTIRVSAISTDGSSTIDNPYQQDTCETNTFSVVDDDTDAPEVDTFGTGINTKFGSGSSAKPLVIATNGVIVDDRSGSSSNVTYTLDDGTMASLSATTNLQFAIGATDATSEIGQGTSGSTNQVISFSIGTGLSGDAVIPAFDATESGALPGVGNETTNIFTFGDNTIFTANVLSNLFENGTNLVAATIPDNDNDRTNDATVAYHQQVGFLILTDDDVVCPVSADFVITGTFSNGVVADTELASGGWSITGLVSDADSGVNVNGASTTQPDSSPYFVIKDPSGTVRLTEAFGTIGFADGAATTASSVGDTSPGSIGGGIALGIWTAQVVVADNDVDRGVVDITVCTNEFTFEVVQGPVEKVVDGNTNDWVGTPPTVVDSATIDADEFIWRDREAEMRTDPGGAEVNNDIEELRIAADETNLYFYVKLQDIDNFAHPYIAIAVDVDQNPADSESETVGTANWGMNFIGDDAGASMGDGYYTNGSAAMHYAERQIIVHNIDGTGQRIELFAGGSWFAPPTSANTATVWSTSNDIIEFKIDRGDLLLDNTVTARLSVATFQNAQIFANDGDSTTNYPTVDILDTLSITPYGSNNNDLAINTFNEEAHDGDVDFWFDVRLDSNGLVANTLPTTPTMNFPTNDTALEPGGYVFTWDTSTDSDDEVTSYLFELSTNANFNGGENGTIGYRHNTRHTNVFLAIHDSLAATQYYWRVRARDKSGMLSGFTTNSFQITGDDDDIVGPIPTLLFVGSNYTVGAMQTNIFDADLNNTNDLVDIAVVWTDPSGVFMTNHPPYDQDNILNTLGRIIPNWDLETSNTVTEAVVSFGFDEPFDNFIGFNGANSVTTYFQNAFTVTNITFDNRFFLTVSAEDEDNDRGTTPDEQGDGDPIPIDHSITTNFLLEFNVVDDDAVPPFLRAGINETVTVDRIWINEVDYDIAGSETNEWIELVAAEGTVVSNYQILSINSGGSTSVFDLNTSFVFSNELHGFGFFVVGEINPAAGVTEDYLQAGMGINNSPASLMLQRISDETSVHLIDYEGDNPATAEDQIENDGDNGSDDSTSIFLTMGEGVNFYDFYWTNTANSGTPGAVNPDQFLLKRLTDAQIAAGGHSITGSVQDTYSGIDGTGTNAPFFDMFNNNGNQLYDDENFDVAPTVDGAAILTAEPLGDTIAAAAITNITLGVYTSIVTVTDIDNDRVNDSHETNVVLYFEVIDDDTNEPAASDFYANTTNVVTDAQLAAGGWTFTGLVSDADSGIASNNVAVGDDFGINYDMLNPTNASVFTDRLFPVAPTNGAGVGVAESVADLSVPVVPIGERVLGTWTAYVSMVDIDTDRTNDSLSIINSNVTEFLVIDDDTNSPAITDHQVLGTGGGLSDFNTILYYDMDEENGTVSDLFADTEARELVGGELDISDGSITSTTADGNPGLAPSESGGWADTSKYWTVTVIVSPDFQMAVTNISFDERTTSTAADQWFFRSESSGFGVDAASGTLATDSDFHTESAAVSLSGITGTNEFRLYGGRADGASGGGSWRLDNLTFQGSVIPIPGAGVVTDDDLANNTLIITARVQDVTSGVYSNTGDQGPVLDFLTSTNSILDDADFDVGPDTDGDALGSAESLIYTNLNISTNEITIGIYTNHIVVTDFDNDRNEDFLSVTSTVTFNVIDDDDAAPVKGTQMKVAYGDSESFISSSGAGTNVLFDVNDGRLRDIAATNILEFTFFVDDDSGLSRGTSDPTTEMNMSVEHFTTSNVAQYNQSKSSAVNFAGDNISNVWTYTTALTYDEVTTLFAQTNPIVVDMFDLDFDRANDQLTALDVQFGLFTVGDDDEATPRARTNTPAFTEPALSVFVGGDPDRGFSGSAIIEDPGATPANDDERELQKYVTSDGSLTNLPSADPLHFKFWIFDSPSGLEVGDGGTTTNTTLSIGSTIVSNNANYDASGSETEKGSQRLATLSTQYWSFTSFDTNTVGGFYDEAGHSNAIVVHAFDGDDDRESDQTMTNITFGSLIVFDDDANGPTLPGSALYDPFTDGARTAGADPADAAWFTQTGSMVLSVDDDRDGLANGNALSIANSAGGPVVVPLGGDETLSDEDEYIVLSFNFRFTNNVNSTTGLRFGLYDDNGTAAAADNDNNSDNDFGYGARVGTGTSAGADLVEESGGTGDVLAGGDVTSLANDAGFNLDETITHSAEFVITKLTNGVNIELYIDMTQIVAFADTAGSIYTNFNTLALATDAGTDLVVDDVSVARSSVMVVEGWTNVPNFNVQWTTNDVQDETGLGEFRITTNTALPTAATDGNGLGIVTQAAITVTNQGIITNWLFAVDADGDRPSDQAKGNNAKFVTKYDPVPPVLITNITVTEGPDNTSEIQLTWDPLPNGGNREGDNAELSPWYSYAVFFTDENRPANTNDERIIFTNGPSDLADITNSDSILSNFVFGTTFNLGIAGVDSAGNVGPISTDEVIITLSGFFVTQGVTEVKAIVTNASHLAWTASTNAGGDVNRAYDLLYWDSPDFLDTHSNQWDLIQTVTNSFLVDEGQGSGTNPTTLTTNMRFYRASLQGRWQTNFTKRAASERVYVLRNIQLYPGQNWVSFPGSADTNTASFIFGTDLPSASTIDTATKVSWFERDGTPSATNTIFLQSSAGSTQWVYSVGGVGSADDVIIPLEAGCVIEIPTNESVQTLQFIGSVPTNTIEQVLPNSGAYSLIGHNQPRRLHPDQMGLLEAGFVGGSHPVLSDRIWKYDRNSQQVPATIFYDTGSSTWKFTSAGRPAVPTNYFSPDDAIVVWKRRPGDALGLTNKVLYTPPTKEMTP